MHIVPFQRSNYHSYLLRLWRDGTGAHYRASLRCTATEKIYHFATVEALFAFLTGEPAPGEESCDNVADPKPP